MSELPIRMARARLLFLLLSLGVSLASSASRHPALAPCLRCRGGAAGIAKPDMPVVAAARKLCTSSGLIASSGSAGISLSNHVRGIVFGGMDGILTTFALLAAAAGTKTSHSLTLVISISTVLADALSMAAGEYLSAKAEEELQGAAFKRPLDDPHPLEKGAAMFIAFTLFGSMPLLGFVITAMLAKGRCVVVVPLCRGGAVVSCKGLRCRARGYDAVPGATILKRKASSSLRLVAAARTLANACHRHSVAANTRSSCPSSSQVVAFTSQSPHACRTRAPAALALPLSQCPCLTSCHALHTGHHQNDIRRRSVVEIWDGGDGYRRCGCLRRILHCTGMRPM